MEPNTTRNSTAKPRILVFNNGIVTQEGMSGSDNRALNWSRVWSEFCDVTIVLPRGGEKRYADHKIERIFTTQRDFLWASSLKLLAEYIIRVVRGISKTRKIDQKVDVIYSSSDLIPDAIPALVLKYSRQKKANLVMGCHLLAPNPFKGYRGETQIPSLKNLYYYFTQSLILNLARNRIDKILVSNKLDKQTLIREKSFSPDQVLVSYGGLNFAELQNVRNGAKLYDAIFVGRMHPQKGVEDLVTAWQEVCAEKTNAKLVILGETESFRKVRDRFSRLGLEKNVEFAGYLSSVKKYEKIKASKVLVFPSHYESFGMVALEALACGVPVVSYDLEIFKEIYGDKLITVRRGDASALAKAVLTNLDRCRDGAYTNSLKTFAGHFDFHQTAELVYKSVLG